MATFYNQATLSFNGGSVNSNITTGEILEVLSASKTAILNEYSQGNFVTYVINLVNSGSTPFNALTLTDNLGENGTATPLDYVAGTVTYFVNGVLQPAPTVTDTSPLTITGINIPANSNAAVLYTVRVNEFAPPTQGGTITNTAVISGTGITPITVTETINSLNAPSLTITKSVSPAIVAENGQITYSFVISNFGNTEAVATDNLVITDMFDPILSDIAVTYNNTPWTEPANYTYNEATGLFRTNEGQITVPEATFTQNPATGEWTITPGTVTITVTGTV